MKDKNSTFAIFALVFAIALLGVWTFVEKKSNSSVELAEVTSEIKTVCVDGYSYMTYKTGFGAGITQMFENKDGTLVAKTCNPTVEK